MSLQTSTWETDLLSLAYEAHRPEAQSPARPGADAALLDRAYDHCRALTAGHSRSFFLASGLLPPAKRRAVRALYAFCRLSDDIVDCAGPNAATKLAAWRKHILAPSPPADSHHHNQDWPLVGLAWADSRAQFQIPIRYAEQLIEGVAVDLNPSHYPTFEQLAAYAYGVAATVGLMSMHITSFSGPEAIPYAIKLGVALQVTNILRDVAEDWRAGRVYLPQEELAAFNLSEADLAAGRIDRRWRAFMRFQIERNRQLYQQAWPGIALLHPDGRLAIAAAARFYMAILDDIEAHDYDVFSRRAYLPGWGKLRLLPGLWWATTRMT